jgi:hypothetical protein
MHSQRDRIAAGQRIAGVVILAVTIRVGAIADLVVMIECSQDDGREKRVRYVPF